MNAPVCSHERDVLDVVAIGQWPQRADAQLRAHVMTCATCAEVAGIAVAVREWSDGGLVAQVPDASVVWHRAQATAREAAARTASRPVRVAQGVAALAFVVGLVWMGPEAGWYVSVWQTLVSAMPAVSVNVPSLSFWPGSVGVETFTSGWGRTTLLALGVLIGLASVALGALRFSEDR